MQTERHSNVGVDGADRRFRCCGSKARCGIYNSSPPANGSSGGRAARATTTAALSATTVVLAISMHLSNGANAFSPQSAAGSARISTRNSGVVLSSAYTKTKSLPTTGTSSKKQRSRSSKSPQSQPPLIFDDVDGIGQYPTDIMDSLLDEEYLSFLTNGSEGENQQAAANVILSTGLPEVDTNEMLLNRDKKAKSIASAEEEEAPSVSKIIKFAIPAIGVWLCGPILSLIDTSAVGLLSGTAQQAALNPAVAISDYTNLLLAFLFTATTNLSASAQAADKGDATSPQTTKTLITALQLSGYVGTAVGAALILGSKFLVKTMVGNDAIDPEVIAAAMNYVRIRALGVPAAAIIGSAQSACLGMKDIRSPLYVLLAAAVVNFFGDVLFVGSSNPLIGGAAGAAWATTFSQYAALGMFLKWLRSPGKKNDKVQQQLDDHESSPASTVNISNAIMELTGAHGSKGSGRRAKFSQALKSLRMSSSSNDAGADDKATAKKADDDTFSTRGFLKNKMQKRDIFKFPSPDSAKEFLPYVLPVTTTSIGRVSSYAAMAHVVASSLGTVAMAAQQIVLSLFYCLTPIADSLGLTAQSFVPGIHSQKDSSNRPEAIRQTTTNFYKAGAIFSAAMVGAVATIPIFSKFFTSDPTVVGMVNSVAPFLALFFASHGMFSASEGVLLGQKDLGFLGKSYATFFAVVPALMLQVKRAALSGTRVVDLTSVWGVFVSYQLFRSVMWGLRLLQLQRRVNSEAALQA